MMIMNPCDVHQTDDGCNLRVEAVLARCRYGRVDGLGKGEGWSVVEQTAWIEMGGHDDQKLSTNWECCYSALTRRWFLVVGYFCTRVRVQRRRAPFKYLNGLTLVQRYPRGARHFCRPASYQAAWAAKLDARSAKDDDDDDNAVNSTSPRYC